jgi:inner membrane protein
MISSVFPDADVLAFDFGIPYEHMYGHRGFTHSIVFALIWAFLMIFLFHRDQIRPYILGCYYFICTISHGLLDAMTTGGRGVAFFAPFSDERYFLPWRFIHVSPLRASHFFSEWGLKVIKNEMIYVGLPCLLLISVGFILNRYFYNSRIL